MHEADRQVRGKKAREGGCDVISDTPTETAGSVFTPPAPPAVIADQIP